MTWVWEQVTHQVTWDPRHGKIFHSSLLLVWGPAVCWEQMRTLGLSQSFTSQNSSCKVGQNGSFETQGPWLHTPEHHCQIQSKWNSYKQGSGPLTRDNVQLTVNSVFCLISNFWSNIIANIIVKERVFRTRDFIEILVLLLLALGPWARSPHASVSAAEQ